MTAPVSAPLSAVRRAVGMAALTAWIDASLRGGSSADHLADAADQVQLRRIVLPTGALPPVLAVAQLRAEGGRCARLVLPAPGDPSGLPGPPWLNRVALAEGAAVIITSGEPSGQATVLLPSGDGEWPAHRVPLAAAVAGSWPTLRQARAEFGTAVAGHSQALTALDVAADAPGLRGLVQGEDERPLPALPPGLPDEGIDLLARARLVALLAATATGTEGAAVSAAEASSRAAHLRALGGIARRAIAAAVSRP